MQNFQLTRYPPPLNLFLDDSARTFRVDSAVPHAGRINDDNRAAPALAQTLYFCDPHGAVRYPASHLERMLQLLESFLRPLTAAAFVGADEDMCAELFQICQDFTSERLAVWDVRHLSFRC